MGAFGAMGADERFLGSFYAARSIRSKVVHDLEQMQVGRISRAGRISGRDAALPLLKSVSDLIADSVLRRGREHIWR